MTNYERESTFLAREESAKENDNHLLQGTSSQIDPPHEEVDWVNAPRTTLEEFGPDVHWTPKTMETTLSLTDVTFIAPQRNKEIDRGEEEFVEDFFERASRYPLLNRELEQLLFQARSEGKSMKDIATNEQFFTLFKEEDQEKAVQLANDSRSIDELLYLANMRFIEYKIAGFKGALPHADLLQIGGMGLFKAIQQFDYTKGYKFSSYAGKIIHYHAIDGLSEANDIHLPPHVLKNLSAVREYIRGYNAYYGADPTYTEVKEHLSQMGKSKSTIDELFFNIQNQRFRHPKSLDTPLANTEKNTSLGDFIPNDSEGSDPFTITQILLMKKDVLHQLDRLLTAKEAEVIKKRFGLFDGRSRTLEEIGNEEGTTREWIRQLETRAMGKIRQNAEHLAKYLD